MVEYSAEEAKAQVTNSLKANLIGSNITLHTISLPLKKHPLDVARSLTDQLNSLSPGLVFIQGFDTAFHQSFSLKYAFEVLRTLRESFIVKDLRQIWWLSPNAHSAFLHTPDDFYSYFMRRLFLTQR